MLLAHLVLGDDASEKDILEIGTGSGYQAAILAERCRSLVSIDVERDPAVAAKLPAHVCLITGNGYEYDTGEEFDGILVTFAAQGIAEAWVRQLKDGGTLVVPLQRGESSAISVLRRNGTRLDLVEVVAYAPFTKGVDA